jgi:RNA polymerase sigma-70 factor (ECF subfamily)
MRVMDAEPEAELSRRARHGDAEAFGRLVERHMRRAYAHALGIVGSREDARDLSQEAFARAYRARHTLDPDRPFYGWLYQILRRVCFNFLRDRKTRAALLEADAPDWLARDAASQLDPASAAQRADTGRRLASAIAALPPHEREVLVLKEFEELKYREIAELLAIPIGTVMSRLYSARKRLAEAMESFR